MKWGFLFFTVCILNIGICNAQLNYTVKLLTPDDGLSQGSNYGRLEDSEGFMWITAMDALNRFDGHRVKVYHLNRYFKNCPRLTQAYGIVESPDKDLYIGSLHGLYRYHRREDKFSLIEVYPSHSKLVVPIGMIGQQLWCVNEHWELVSYDVGNERKQFKGKAPISGPSAAHIYSNLGLGMLNSMPFIDKNQVIWFFHKNQIVQYQTKNDSFVTFSLQAKFKQITCVHYDLFNHYVYIGTEHGFVQYDIANRTEKLYNKLGNQEIGYMRSIATNQKYIAIVSEHLNLVISEKKSGLSQKKSIINKRGDNWKFHSLMFDKTNRLWACNDGLGQRIYDLNSAEIIAYPGDNMDFKKLKESGVSTFGETKDGKILTQYFAYLNSQTNQLHYRQGINKDCRLETDLYSNAILGYGSKQNKSGAFGLYISEFDSELKEKTIFTGDIKLTNHLQCLRALARKQYMVSSVNGLFWFDRKKFTPILHQPYTNSFQINLLSRNRAAISYLENDMQLIEYDVVRKTVKFLGKILPGVQSYYVQEDQRRNKYWVGTNDGVFLLDRQFKILRSFSINDGLAGSNIFGILLDSLGNCWCAHQRGLSQIKANDFHIINYDKSDDIQDWDFNNRGFYKASDGRLYFGGVSGFNMIYPNRKRKNNYFPQIYIDEIKVDNQVLDAQLSPNMLDELKLKNEDNRIEFSLSIRDLNMRYSTIIYRIIELDTQWQKLKVHDPLIFNKLAGGHYNLELGYFDRYENKYYKQKSLRIIIPTPFYKTITFWVILCVASGGLLLQYYHRLKFRKQQNLLQRQIEEDRQRQKITADLHDDLGASLSSLQVNSTIALNQLDRDPIKARHILEKIVHQSQSITETMSDFIWSLRHNKEQFMTLSTRIKTYANEILGSKEIEFQFDYDPEIDTKIQDATQKKNLVMILREMINNAAKYSEASHVIIRINIVNEVVQIKIEDNGKGFDSHKVSRSGLANIEFRIEELKGTMNLKTALHQGTKYEFQFPLHPLI